MTTLADSLATVRTQVRAACQSAGRPPDQVRLVAVSKKVPAARLAEALALGQAEFGESYVQEALPKIAALPRDRVTWHFIGPVQSNKTADLATHFDWVHGVDREKVAQRLSDQRPPGMPPLNVCVQVNISGEASKAGVPPGEAAALCQFVAGLPRLRLRGLMAIPAKSRDAPYFLPFRKLRELHESLLGSGLQLDTLSAGMSDDFAAAIAEGSTLVRIGTAIFGERTT